MSKLQANEALQKIDEYKDAWHGLVPQSRFDWFVERVKTAIETYYTLSEPAELSAELKKIERAARNHSASLPSLVKNASPMAQEILERDGHLASLPDADDDESLAEFAHNTRTRIVVSECWRKDGAKRRRKIKTGISLPFKRPKREKIMALVSLVASACSVANGEATKRSWSGEKKTPIEAVLEDIFDALAIDNTHSVNEALRRHVASRNSLEQTIKS